MLKEARIESGVSRVVNRTIVRERPSTPTWKDEWIASYQGYCSTNWKPAADESKRIHNRTESPNGIRLATSAAQRMTFTSSLGRNRMTSAANTGKKRMRVRRWLIRNSMSCSE